MVKSDGHIDIVFRDGLKNMEVLPPADVWDNISAEISAPVSGAWVFRIAAGVAAIVSLGLLAFFVGIRTSENSLNTLTAEQVQQVDEGFALLDMQDQEPVIAELIQNTNYSPGGSAIKENISSERALADRGSQLVSTSPTLAADRFDLVTLELQDDPGKIVTEDLRADGEKEILLNMDYDQHSADRKGKWMLGAKISPTYLTTNLKADNNLLAGQQADESALLSYSGGLSVVYSVGNRLSLQTGIYYSSLGRQVSQINSYSGFSSYVDAKGGKIFGIETTTGTISSTNKDIYLVDASSDRISSIASAQNFDPDKAGLDQFGSSLRQNFEYIEVPFMLSYKLIDKKVDFNIMGGMSYSLLLDNEVYAVSDGSVIPIGSMEDLAGLLLSSSFGMSMNYALNENFSLNLEPTIRYYLNSDGSLSASNNPFAFGIFSGVYYKF